MGYVGRIQDISSDPVGNTDTVLPQHAPFTPSETADECVRNAMPTLSDHGKPIDSDAAHAFGIGEDRVEVEFLDFG